VARTFRDQPPVIPHAMTNFDEITTEENQCLTCHDLENYQKKEAPRLSDSHLRDPRTNKPLKNVSAARYNCTQCHVPQADAPPLVENSFQGLPPLPAKKP
jgi:cytochrome c-type protein NapB